MRATLRIRRLSSLGALGAILLGWYLRLANLAGRSPWFDEALEVFQGLHFPHNFISIARGETVFLYDPPAYYALLSVLEAVSLESLWLRLPSLGGGLVAVALVWRAGAACESYLGAVNAALILALAPTAIYFSQEINQYGLVMAVSALILWMLCRLSKHLSVSSLAVLGAALLAGVWIHYSFAFVLAASAAAVLVDIKRAARCRGRYLLLIVLLVAVGTALLAPFAYQQVQTFSSPGVSPLSAFPPAADLARRLLEVLLTLLYGRSDMLRSVSAVYAIAVISLGVAGLVRRKTRLVGIALVAGTSFVLAAYYLGAYPLGGWLGRHQVVWLPFLVFTVSVGVDQVISTLASATAHRWNGRSREFWRASCVGLYAVLLGALLVMVGTQNGAYAETNPQITVLGALLREAKAESDDEIYVYYGGLPTVAYTQLSGGLGPENQQAARDRLRDDREWPTSCWGMPSGPCRVGQVVYSPWQRGRQPSVHLEAMHLLSGSRPQAFWLVFSHVWESERDELVGYLQREGWRINRVLEGQGSWAYHVCEAGGCGAMPTR